MRPGLRTRNGQTRSLHVRKGLAYRFLAINIVDVWAPK